MFDDDFRQATSKTKPPKLLKDRFMLESMVFAFSRRHFLYKVFNRKLQQYIEADLINFNVRSFRESNSPKKFEECKKPFAILTFGQLEAGFVVCLVPFVLSIFVFTMEWASRLQDLIVSLFIFKTFFQVKNFEQKKRLATMRLEIVAAKALLQLKIGTADDMN